jgi:hypothetical protein
VTTQSSLLLVVGDEKFIKRIDLSAPGARHLRTARRRLAQKATCCPTSPIACAKSNGDKQPDDDEQKGNGQHPRPNRSVFNAWVHFNFEHQLHSKVVQYLVSVVAEAVAKTEPF